VDSQQVSAPLESSFLQDPAKTKPTSKDRRHAVRKRIAMRRGQYACIVPGGGLNVAALVDLSAGLIRATQNGLLLYRAEK
jgi:hypothetical protein